MAPPPLRYAQRPSVFIFSAWSRKPRRFPELRIRRMLQHTTVSSNAAESEKGKFRFARGRSAHVRHPAPQPARRMSNDGATFVQFVRSSVATFVEHLDREIPVRRTAMREEHVDSTAIIQQCHELRTSIRQSGADQTSAACPPEAHASGRPASTTGAGTRSASACGRARTSRLESTRIRPHRL